MGTRVSKMAVRIGLIVAASVFMAQSVMAASAAAAGDANMSSCPQATEESPGFRTYLPDCRAYELVSPSFTDGFAVFGGLSKGGFAVSEAGTVIGGVSLGGVAGSENSYIAGNSLGNPYLFKRSPEGWQTEAQSAPVSQVPSPVEIDQGASLENSLWASGNTAGIGDFTTPIRLFRRETDGAVTEIGPVRSSVEQAGNVEFFEGQYLGSSSDLSRVVFQLKNSVNSSNLPLWAGDETIPGDDLLLPTTTSLYEYTGTDNSEPSMIGVTTEGSLVAKARAEGLEHVNEAAEGEEITQCGTVLGSGSDAFNAVSSDGLGVFFSALPGPCESQITAEEHVVGTGPTVKELYVRIQGERTLALSEPPLGLPGRVCTGVCADSQMEENGHERSPATFLGASEDGSRVYFSTVQPLVDEDTDETSDLYMEELGAGGITRLVDVSAGGAGDPTPGSGAQVAGVARISADGRRAYFVAEGLLTTRPNANGESAEAGRQNLYVYDAASGRLSFVARLANADAEKLWLQPEEHNAQTSATDGRYFVFVSKARPQGTGDTSGNGNNVGQLFEYDAEPGGDAGAPGTVTRVSIGQAGQYRCQATGLVEAGYNCDGNTQLSRFAPQIPVQSYGRKDGAYAPYVNVAVMPDGSVLFASRLALTPAVANGYPNSEAGLKNVYEYRDGNVYLISDGVEPVVGEQFGTPESATLPVGFTNDGGALFLTSDQLVPADTNTQISLYDAHVDGGFPGPPGVPGCGGSSCRGSGSAAGGTGPVGTTVDQGNGNVVSKKHRKHKHKKKHRKHKHKEKSGRDAGKGDGRKERHGK